MMNCIEKRRRFLSSLTGLLLLPVNHIVIGKQRISSAIRQPDNPDAQHFMVRAREMERMAVQNGDQSYGAIVVKGNIVVGEAPSRVVTAGDPTAHAEMEAIRDASHRLGSGDLTGCIMYSTSPPCAMCETAAHWANLKGLIYGTASAKVRTPRFQRC